MNRFLQFALFLSVLCLQLGVLKASHVPGGQLSYACVNSCTTRVNLKVYRDCQGAVQVGTNLTWIPMTSGCTQPTSLTPWTFAVATELTLTCPGSVTSCSNIGSPLPGIEELDMFRDYDICTGSPCSFTLLWHFCCRNGGVSALVSPSIEENTASALLTTGLSSCNSSPQFLSPAKLFINEGQTNHLSLAAHDVDGDSIAYELSSPIGTNLLPPAFASGYSSTAPLGPTWNVSLDAVTGDMTLSPNPGNITVGLICVRANEYRNGQLIGYSSRDHAIYVMNNPSNTGPSFQPISNPSTGATIVGNEVFVCGLAPVCFDITGIDVNTNQNLKLTYSHNLLGATLTDLSNNTVVDTVFMAGPNPVVGRYCFTPPAVGDYTVQFHLQDNACPFLGVAERAIVIHVGQGAATASASLAATCPTVNFTASTCGMGPYTYHWSGTGGFSSNLQSPSYQYSAPGLYTWQVIISDGSLSDTIIDSIQVAWPSTQQSLFQGGYYVAPCLGTLHDTLDPGAFASYLWSTGATSPQLVVSTGGTYGITVTDANGCTYTDAAVVTAISPSIEGHILTSTNAPLQNQKVYLIMKDTLIQVLTAVDSMYTDQTGYYHFCNVNDSLVLIKAAPDSADYPNEMPTYAVSSLFWSGAITHTPMMVSAIVQDFSTLYGNNPGGPGFIGGLIVQGANKTAGIGDPVPGLMVFLRAVGSIEPIGYRYTDANGYFSFANIPFGNYELIPDRYLVSTSNVPLITINAQNVVADSLDLQLHQTWLELVEATVQVGAPQLADRLLAYPNPFVASTTVQLDLAAAGHVKLALYDIMGKQVRSIWNGDLAGGQHRYEIGADLPAGLYFLKLQINGVEKVLKLNKE